MQKLYKTDGRFNRNYLLGTDGDRINALLAAAGHILRPILKALNGLICRFGDLP